MMEQNSKYFVVKQKAVPEVLRKVVEAKRLLESEKITIGEATERVGISRSSFYKYKDDIFPFYDNSKGKTVTLVIQMMDELGFLSELCSKISKYKANILTIHQSIPVNGVATLTISIEVRSNTGDISAMIGDIEAMERVKYVKILAQENTLS